ncbi:hypothetical protein RRG08_055216 [Elysia crispata]|uniref:Uncharacterized protein n=1 Tax=Elysia crispata TaxID=231223 RepID=A0AAE0XT60_9GAST|nr:hypothetical protein RRG08_055216 [Elysia crispata]
MYCRKAKLRLPLKSILEEYKCGKARLLSMLEDSEDPIVKTVQPTDRKWKVVEAVSQAKECLKIKEVSGQTQTDRKRLRSSTAKWWSNAEDQCTIPCPPTQIWYGGKKKEDLKSNAKSRSIGAIHMEKINDPTTEETNWESLNSINSSTTEQVNGRALLSTNNIVYHNTTYLQSYTSSQNNLQRSKLQQAEENLKKTDNQRLKENKMGCRNLRDEEIFSTEQSRIQEEPNPNPSPN